MTRVKLQGDYSVCGGQGWERGDSTEDGCSHPGKSKLGQGQRKGRGKGAVHREGLASRPCGLANKERERWT